MNADYKATSRSAMPLLKRSPALSSLRVGMAMLGILLSACDATGPQSFKPGLTVRVLGSVTDTITAPPVELLVVARDSIDRPIAHAPVQFLFPDSPPGSGRGVLRGDTVSPPFPLETDSTGAFRGLILYGVVAGDWWLYATVVTPHETLVDSVRMHTQPGQPARIVLSPRDSALYQGGTEILKATVVDRGGNLRTEPAQLEVVTTGIQIQGTTVTAVAGPSRQLVLAHYGMITDSAWISIVPHGTIVVRNMRFNGPDVDYVFISMELDGSNYHPFLLHGGPGNLGNNDKYMAPEWTANGDVVFFDGYPNKQLWRTTTSGVVTPLFPRATENDIWQQLTKDSAWVYFEGTNLGVQSTYLYRATSRRNRTRPPVTGGPRAVSERSLPVAFAGRAIRRVRHRPTLRRRLQPEAPDPRRRSRHGSRAQPAWQRAALVA